MWVTVHITTYSSKKFEKIAMGTSIMASYHNYSEKCQNKTKTNDKSDYWTRRNEYHCNWIAGCLKKKIWVTAWRSQKLEYQYAYPIADLGRVVSVILIVLFIPQRIAVEALSIRFLPPCNLSRAVSSVKEYLKITTHWQKTKQIQNKPINQANKKKIT